MPDLVPSTLPLPASHQLPCHLSPPLQLAEQPIGTLVRDGFCGSQGANCADAAVARAQSSRTSPSVSGFQGYVVALFLHATLLEPAAELAQRNRAAGSSEIACRLALLALPTWGSLPRLAAGATSMPAIRPPAPQVFFHGCSRSAPGFFPYHPKDCPECLGEQGT